MINIIQNLLNNQNTRMVIIISVIIYISIIDLPLSSFDKIIQKIFNSVVGQLFILLFLNHYLTNKDYGISLLLIVLYCFIIKIKMSNNIINDYSETNKNEKNNLIYEKLSDLESESSVSNNIEESLSDINDIDYLDESNDSEIDDYINNVNNDGVNNELFETERVKMKGGNKKKFVKKMIDNTKKKTYNELKSKSLSTLLDYQTDREVTQDDFDELVKKIDDKQEQIKRKEDKYINILDNNVIYNNDNTEILDIKKKNKKEELLAIIKRNKKLDLNNDDILDYSDNNLNLKEWEKDIDKWMPTQQVLNDWSEMYDKMVNIKEIKNVNYKEGVNKSTSKDFNKKIGGKKETFLSKLEALEHKLNKDYNTLN